MWAQSQPPAAALSCSSGEVPVAVVQSITDEKYGWECGKAPSCASDQELAWKKTGEMRDWGWASAYVVQPQCVAQCKDDEERAQSGSCIHRKTPEEVAADRQQMAEYWRRQNPAAACMQDCANDARQCVMQCRQRGGGPYCASGCQESVNSCTAQCQSGGGSFGRAEATPPTISQVPAQSPQAPVQAPPAQQAARPRGPVEPVRHCVQNPDNNCWNKKFYCDATRENLEHPGSDTSDGHGNRICCWLHYHP